MSENVTNVPKGLWALLTSVVGWLIPMAVYYALSLIFGSEAVWPEARPYLLVSFSALAVFAQISAIFIAIIGWPARLAKVTIVVACLLLAWNGLLLVQALAETK